MPTILICSYSSLVDAENARHALLASGVPLPDVQLESKEDEAGPVQGNFVSGNTSDSGSSRTMFGGFRASKVGDEDQTYAQDYRDAVNRGTILLSVEISDDAQYRTASDIMDRFGGIDISARTSGSDSRR